MTYLRSFLAWFLWHHSGHNRFAKAKRYARSQAAIYRKARAERKALRGLPT